MIRLLVGFFLLAQGIIIYFGVIFLIGILIPDAFEALGAKGPIVAGIVTLGIQFILIKRYTEPEELTEEEIKELEEEF
jgi:hypothetical protein